MYVGNIATEKEKKQEETQTDYILFLSLGILVSNIKGYRNSNVVSLCLFLFLFFSIIPNPL